MALNSYIPEPQRPKEGVAARSYTPLSPTEGEAFGALMGEQGFQPAGPTPGVSGLTQRVGGGGGGSKYNPTDAEMKMRELRERIAMQRGPTGLAAAEQRLQGAHPADQLGILESYFTGGPMAQLPNPFMQGNPVGF